MRSIELGSTLRVLLGFSLQSVRTFGQPRWLPLSQATLTDS